MHIDKDKLELYVLGRLDAVEALSVTAHVQNCGRCNRRLVEIRDYVRALQEALRRDRQRNIN